uniref:Uncharacterized protein n=1 Tax=Arundo donax TaxID=35708 RepID=A0A0A9B5B6_ARUDO
MYIVAIIEKDAIAKTICVFWNDPIPIHFALWQHLFALVN